MGRRHPAAGWIVLGIWILVGCARPQVGVVPPVDWAAAGSGAWVTDQGRVFHGIGRASGLRSTALLRATADNQAQTEMARVLTVYVARLAEAAAMDPTGSDDRALLHDLSQALLKKARIVAHQDLSDAGSVVSLCRLELQDVLQVLGSDTVFLDSAVRRRMLSHAERVHDAMAGRR